MFSAGLGHEYPAVLAIVCAFMVGMAMGASRVDRLVPRDGRARWWLAMLELTIGVWALLVSFFMPQINNLALQWIGLQPDAIKHWSIAFVIPLLTLLPATMAMGATLPTMEKVLSMATGREASVGTIYAANTFGAVAGTLVAPWVLIPRLGLMEATWVMAGVNVCVCILVFLAAPRSGAPVVTADQRAASPSTLSPERISFTFLCTGILGMGYEAAGVRALSQVMENTIYTYASILATFLVGTAVGAATLNRIWRGREVKRLLAALLCASSAACFLGISVMARSGDIYKTLRQWGDSSGAVLAAELVTAFAVFGLPTFFMGATFSHLAQQARAVHGRIGNGVALNTIGAGLAPVLLIGLLPAIGVKWTLLMVSFGYAALSFPIRPPALALAGLIFPIIACFSTLQIVDLSPGSRVTEYREGVMGTVAVVEDSNSQRTLRVDNRFQMGGTVAADAEYRQAHVPLLLHPSPGRALFLGLGTGISFGAATLYPELKADGVELVPEVVHVIPLFAPANRNPGDQPNLKIYVADARRFVRTAPGSYDVIVADVFHPYRDGAGSLYTTEHFAAVKQRLSDGGLFCQWLPLHQLDAETLRIIVRSFLTVFPQSEAWLLRFNVDVPVIALVSGRGLETTDAFALQPNNRSLAEELRRLALADPLRLFGHWLADTEDLEAFSRNAPLNTDDNQRVTLLAPRVAYQTQAKPYESLLALMDTANVPSIARRTPSELTSRLQPYLQARNVYLRGLVHDAERRHEQAVAAYLESARLSPDFTSGYAQCLNIANVIAPSDPARAKKILEELKAAQPERPVAGEMLKRLFPGTSL